VPVLSGAVRAVPLLSCGGTVTCRYGGRLACCMRWARMRAGTPAVPAACARSTPEGRNQARRHAG